MVETTVSQLKVCRSCGCLVKRHEMVAATYLDVADAAPIIRIKCPICNIVCKTIGPQQPVRTFQSNDISRAFRGLK